MDNFKIAVIGLGYVGLPLARLFSTKYQTVGFDMNQSRVDALNAGHDATLEVSDELLQAALKSGFKCTTQLDEIKDCNFYVVAVPTPVDSNNRPDLKPLWGASETVGKVISKGNIVVYESTVYPGVTEEECLPVVEKVSGLKFNIDFFAGYSPERINPGDREHTVEKIKKVTSGSTLEVADIVDRVYNSVLINGTHKAPSIKVAEASKIIENSQRDVNIAFMNELAKIFNAMGIDTNDVIEAAASKWNFIKLKPGLVGGHCISVIGVRNSCVILVKNAILSNVSSCILRVILVSCAFCRVIFSFCCFNIWFWRDSSSVCSSSSSFCLSSSWVRCSTLRRSFSFCSFRLRIRHW